MKLLSATDLAIALAIKDGSLKVSEWQGRFGAYWSIEDSHGLIEVALSAEEAEARIAKISESL